MPMMGWGGKIAIGIALVMSYLVSIVIYQILREKYPSNSLLRVYAAILGALMMFLFVVGFASLLHG